MGVLIVGKGPSARPVPKACSYPVAALNGAANICERIDWLFTNDLGAFAEIDPVSVRVARAFVMPNLLHVDQGRLKVSHRAAIPFLHGVPFDLFELHTNRDRAPSLPYFGKVLSVGEAAVAWLIHRGHREFLTTGIDAGGGYSDRFDGGQQDLAKPSGWYRMNAERIRARIEDAGGSVRGWDGLC